MYFRVISTCINLLLKWHCTSAPLSDSLSMSAFSSMLASAAVRAP